MSPSEMENNGAEENVQERVWSSTLRYLCDIQWKDLKEVPGQASVGDKKTPSLERNIWRSLAYSI